MTCLRQIALSSAILAATVGTTTVAKAQVASLGDNGHCVYTVPNGSKSYANGDVYSDGILIGNAATACAALEGGAHPLTCIANGEGPCTVNSECCSGQCNWGYGVCADGGPYPANVTASTYSGTGYQDRFNGIYGYWTVPAAPDNADAMNANVLWIGVQDGLYDVIQPVLKFEEDGNWYIFTESITGCSQGGCNDVQQSPIQVYPGDVIYGWTYIQAGNSGSGDEWFIGIEDTTYGHYNYSYNWALTGSDNPAFNSANLGTLEVHGLLYCDGMSTSNAEEFTIYTLTQEGASWDDYESVISLAPINYNADTNPLYCDWGATYWTGSGDIYPYLYWDWSYGL